jgi:16S rRNA (cytosine1402-N4)-methyltransferase
MGLRYLFSLSLCALGASFTRVGYLPWSEAPRNARVLSCSSTAPEEPHVNSSSAPRTRRVRYQGSWPRRFEERYKEHAGDDDGLIDKVTRKGRTPAGRHVPIMVEEIMSILKPQPGELYVDCTLGYGGHAAEVLRCILPGGVLLGLDLDAIELPKARERLLRIEGVEPANLITVHMNYANLSRALESAGATEGADIILADLGVSSMQLVSTVEAFNLLQSCSR